MLSEGKGCVMWAVNAGVEAGDEAGVCPCCWGPHAGRRVCAGSREPESSAVVDSKFLDHVLPCGSDAAMLRTPFPDVLSLEEPRVKVKGGVGRTHPSVLLLLPGEPRGGSHLFLLSGNPRAGPARLSEVSPFQKSEH